MTANGPMGTQAVDAAPQSVLRLITCGSVDDGKSTLMGRLLYELDAIPEDQLAALKADSRRWGTQGAALDFALLLDGLSAEREQGITIDVSYRYFATARRKFIVADTPGHEQYTRNMVTAASTAQLAVLLVDARQGVQTQTRRHSQLLRLVGVRHVLLLINKMDLVGWSEAVAARIAAEYGDFAARIGLAAPQVIPVSALRGDNLLRRSGAMDWYRGPTLIEALEDDRLDDGAARGQTPLRLPVQWVCRPHSDFRGYAGLIVAGSVKPGDAICVQPSGQEARVQRLVSPGGDRDHAGVDESVMLTLDRELDISRGDLICAAEAPAAVAERFECSLVWMAEEPLLPGRSYLLKLGARTVGAQVAELHHRLDVGGGQTLAAEALGLNEIGVCTLVLDRALPFDPYAENRDTGGFILIDRLSQSTIAAGMLHRALAPARDLHPQRLSVDRAARQQLMGHGSALVWLTGLSGAGKSTIANLLEQRLHAQGCHTYLLDGDHVRRGLCKDLGFSHVDRVENIRRLAEVGRLMVDAGLIVLVAAISPFRAERRLARELMEPGRFLEIHVDVPLAVAEARDPKGLYRKARRGELPNFTGIDSPYEAPDQPELRIDSSRQSAQEAAQQIHELLRRQNIV
ncbi:adenylyl-sulfate kinase [Pelomonas sp. CA6]|uniref:adenylyl-sulfate kinase n=1 Tax=Pelomonas sp. CA6 TaxID=2907999 RepID=UPI001F4C0A45|nr:adenylyl-sulfate kinase [Pelomonas sp. CA6]MCH7345828.1 adenylyl-sulfate kinase [Pelomonas sp. CA6]